MHFDSFALAASLADLDEEPRAREDADWVEFRMDQYASTTGNDPVEVLESYDGELPILATNRASWEGGGASDETDRLDALAKAATLPSVGAVDVEVKSITDGSGADVVERAHAHDTTVIASRHDFASTPPLEILEEWLTTATELADVGKVAVTAADSGDVLDLLSATWSATSAGRRVATMAMGAAGRHSRVVAPLYGSKIGYAPVDAERATAPGQYDLATLSRLVTALE